MTGQPEMSSVNPIPLAIMLRIAIVIFLAEAALVMMRPLLPTAGLLPLIDAMIEASALTLIAGPIIHIWLIRPHIEQAATALAEARHTAAALSKSLARLETTQIILDRHAIVSETGPDGRLRHVNIGFSEISGYDPPELIGRIPSTLASPRHDGAFWKDMERALARDGVWQGEICNRALDGSEYWLACSKAVLRGPDGEPQGGISVCTDITAAKRREVEMAEAHRIAKLASETKTAFLANMSHELRTPMNGVLGMLGLLLDGALDAEQRKLAEAAQLSAETLLGVLSDILDIWALEAGRAALDIADVDVTQALGASIDQKRPAAAEKDLSLAGDLGGVAGLRLRADGARLTRILSAMIDNAIKFTDAGGATVTAEQRPLPDGRIELRIAVSDTGIGIAAGRRDTIFTRFTQGDATHARRFGGLGLGLAIARLLVEHMGGRIGVESAEGHGSRFWFTIPFDAAGGAAAGNSPPARAPAGIPGADNRAS